MGKYRVQKQFWQWDEVVVEADSVDDALATAIDNWHELPVEGVGDYEPTGKYYVIDETTGRQVER